MPPDDRALIDDAVALRTLLASSNEGGTGLYEAIWEFNTKFPEAALSEKYRAASRALRRLHEMSLIEFYRERFDRNGDDRFKTLTISTDEVLEQPVHWYLSYDGAQIGFNATPKGEQANLEPGAA